jgi:hypothetical protein
VWFNLLNKSIFKYFPFPYTVSTVHVIVGTAYCVLVYFMGLKKASFGRVSKAPYSGWTLPAGSSIFVSMRAPPHPAVLAYPDAMCMGVESTQPNLK